MNEQLLDAAMDLDYNRVIELLDTHGFDSQVNACRILKSTIDRYNRECDNGDKIKNIIKAFVEHGFNVSTRAPWIFNNEITESLIEYCGTWGKADVFGLFLNQFGLTQKELDTALANAKHNNYPKSVDVLIALGAKE